MMIASMDDNRKIGIGLCVLGALCFCIGIPFFFDRTLMSLGNFSFLGGLSFLLGPMKTAQFFFKREKFVASFAYFSGLILTLWGYSFIGFVAQLYAIWRLFAAFLPNVFQGLRLIPGMSFVLSLPGFRQIDEYAYDQRRLPL